MQRSCISWSSFPNNKSCQDLVTISNFISFGNSFLFWNILNTAIIGASNCSGDIGLHVDGVIQVGLPIQTYDIVRLSFMPTQVEFQFKVSYNQTFQTEMISDQKFQTKVTSDETF